MSDAGPNLHSYRVAVLSAVKHDYIPRAVDAHARFEVVVVADDPDQPEWVQERNRLLAAELGVPYVPDVALALARHRPEIAVVTSQAERHVDLAMRAVDAGLHLIVDKPLSPSHAECQRLCERVQRRGVKSLVWNRNCHPALIHARNVVSDGSLGELRSVHCDFYFAKDAGPPKGTRRADEPPMSWLTHQIQAHADGSDGGVGERPLGELQVEGLYPLAYMRLLTGRPVKRVFARAASHVHQVHADNGVEDLATLSLEMEGGLIGSICLGRIGAGSHPDLGAIKLHLIGTRSALVVSEPRPEVAVYYRGQPPDQFRHRRVANGNDALLMEDFLRAIEEGGETVLDVAGGRDICAVIEAALRSVESGQPEPV